jgi:hypothetical protein
MFDVPQRKVGRNLKWRRLCRFVQVVRRLNDILYCIKLSPHSAPIVAHIDLLRSFDGELSEPWASAVNRSSSGVIASPSTGLHIDHLSTGSNNRPRWTGIPAVNCRRDDFAWSGTRTPSTDATSTAHQQREPAGRNEAEPIGGPAGSAQNASAQGSASGNETSLPPV